MAADVQNDCKHLIGMIETLQAANAALVARSEAAGDEAACAPARLAKVENRLDRFRAEEIWDRVMQEVAELLGERGPLTPNEILLELRAVTLRGAALHKEPLTPGTLRQKMDIRVFHGRYFEAQDEDRYARRARWRPGGKSDRARRDAVRPGSIFRAPPRDERSDGAIWLRPMATVRIAGQVSMSVRP